MSIHSQQGIQNFVSIIEKLYSWDKFDIINTIQRSKDIAALKRVSDIAIHTGFSFTYCNKMNQFFHADLLYDFVYGRLIQQEKWLAPREWSKCGVAILESSRIYQATDFRCMTRVLRDTDKIKLESFAEYEDFIQFLSSYKFFFIDDEQTRKSRRLPAQKDFNSILEYDGVSFKWLEDMYEPTESYGKYVGTYAQDVEGLSDSFIDDALDGEPDAYWNID